MISRILQWLSQPIPELEADSVVAQDFLARGKKLLQDAARPAVHLELAVEEPVPADATSSVGGNPSLPPSDDWPVDKKGRPMLFLAQLRMDELPQLPGYPAQGLLSFFVGSSSVFGQSYSPKVPSEFTVRYYEEPATLERRQPPVPGRWKSDMFGKRLRAEGAPLRGSLVQVNPFGSSLEFEQILTELGSPPDDTQGPVPLTSKELSKWVDGELTGVADELSPFGIYFGGHVRTCQGEFREPSEGPVPTEVLLQMGFVHEHGKAWQICWGDAGEASFVLAQGDLAAGRFDSTVYHWDCS